MQRYWAGYNGTAVEVYDAAMGAAYSCGQYAHGATIFKKRSNHSAAEVDLNFLLTGLKIFRKLRDRLQTEAVWQQIETKGWVKDVDETTTLQASILLGNISLAASALDVVRTQRMLPDRFHCSSAIRACAMSDQKGKHLAAAYFLDYMMQDSTGSRLQSHQQKDCGLIDSDVPIPSPSTTAVYIILSYTPNPLE